MKIFALALAVQVYEPTHPSRLVPVYEQAIANVVRAQGAEHPGVAEIAAAFGQFLVTNGDAQRGREMLERALRIYERGSDQTKVAGVLESLAGVSGREGEALLERAVAIRTLSPELARSLQRWAELAEARGDSAAAEVRYARALAIYEKTNATDANAGVVLNNLGMIAEGRDDVGKAEGYYRRALAVLQKAYGASHPEVGTTLNNLAGVAGARGAMAEAESLLRRALRILEETLGGEHARVAACAANLGDLLSATRRSSEAAKHYERALTIYAALKDGEGVAAMRERLAATPTVQGASAAPEARPAERKAAPREPRRAGRK